MYTMNVNDLLSNCMNQTDCSRTTTLKRKLFEELTTNDKFDFELVKSIDEHRIKRFKTNITSNEDLIKNRNKKPISKSSIDLCIFDLKSVNKYKFEQVIKRIFEKIQSDCSDENKNDDHNIKINDDQDLIDLNQLFAFNDSNTNDDNLISSLKASFLGKGSFGSVYRTKLEHRCYAIKIGLSNSFYGCIGEQNALILNEHPNVIRTHHILKLKITASDDQLLLKNSKRNSNCDTINEDEYPIIMDSNISYHTMKHIIDLNLFKLIDPYPKHKFYPTLNVIIMDIAGDFSLQQLIDDSTNQEINKERRIHFAKQIADALVYLKSKHIVHLDLK